MQRRDFILGSLAGLAWPLAIRSSAPSDRARKAAQSLGDPRDMIGYLVGNTTGAAKLRAGLPGHWRVGVKTGMGANGATNDVAIVWPAPQKPFLVVAYLAEAAAPEKERNGAPADVGHLVAGWVGA